MQSSKMLYRLKLLVFFIVLFNIPISARILYIPLDHPTLQSGIDAAEEGDTIILSPGTYDEHVTLTKKLTVASSFLLDGNEQNIKETIVDGGTLAVFTITGPAGDTSSLVGITIQNGIDGIMATAPVNLFNNIIMDCGDGIDYDTGGSGIIRNNVFRNNLDDGIDLDGALRYILIEGNVIGNNDDDGIEIRLHPYSGDLCVCRIKNNIINNNGEDGIQFIDYSDTTQRIYILEHNLIYDNKMAGIACMDNAESVEDYRGASIPEAILLLNNTISGNDYGICGGANLTAINTIIAGSVSVGLKNLTGKSLVSYAIIHSNEVDQINSSIDNGTVLYSDPLLTYEFVPEPGSPCIDNGTRYLISGSDTLVRIPADDFYGTAPDIGALEYLDLNSSNQPVQSPRLIICPNPCVDFIEITFRSDDLSEPLIQIFDSSGKLMFDKHMGGQKILLSLEGYRTGIYFLRYSGLKGTETLSFFKF